MASEATVQAIETAVDVATDAAETLERIPKVHLNGTTKAQQIAILLVTAGVSAAVGSAATYKFVSRKLRLRYEEISNAEIEEARQHYIRLTQEHEGATKRVAPPKKGSDESETETKPDEFRTMDAVIENLEYVSRDVRVAPEDGTVMVDPVENGLPTVNEQLDKAAVGFVWDEAAEQSMRDPAIPYVITAEQYLENYPGHEQTKLIYYDGGNVGVVANTDDVMIPDEEVDAWITFANLNRFGHGSDDRYTVYVRNEVRGEDFEIVLSTKSYARDVIGMDDDPDTFEDNKRRARRLRDR